MNRIPSALASALLLSSLAVPAWGGDWYVDAVQGSDQNGGTSWEDAWKTITHAVDQNLGSEPVVHLAPGIYDAASGEDFPIFFEGRPTFLGEAGAASTILDGGHLDEALFEGNTNPVDLRGLTLRNASCGFQLKFPGYNSAQFHCVLEDLVLEGLGIGVYMHVETWVNEFVILTAEMRRVHVENCGAGAQTYTWNDRAGSFAAVEIIAEDCTFAHSTTGISVRGEHDFGYCSASIARCQFFQNQTGVGAGPLGSARVEDSLFVGNSRAFAFGSIGGGSVIRSTIAANTTGITGGKDGHLQELVGSIVYGNEDDLDIENQPDEVSYCDIGDGDFAGGNGNISADPLFVDPSTGDWRLRFGSPCVDTGIPECEESADLFDTLRPVDGDLDAIESCDMGAIEFTPLALVGEPHIGTAITFELWGPAGAASDLWVARSPLLDPQHTPFGEYHLNTRWDFLYASAPCAPGPPGTIVIELPDQPALVGHSVGFQALTDSGLGDPPYAWSNPIELVFLPEDSHP